LNQPKLSSCATWSSNATTIANESWVGQYPVGIFINKQNTIYITNRNNGNILVWHNGSTAPTKTIFANLINSWSLFATISNDIYVDNEYLNGRVDKWTLNAIKSETVMNVNSSCTGIFVNIYNSLYCSSADKHRVFKVGLTSSTTSLTVVGTGCPRPVSNMLDHPHGIFVDNNTNLYVADTHNNRIQRFASDQLNAITIFHNKNLLIHDCYLSYSFK
jgi:sugar lactone lactonase YvrE